MAPLVAGGLLVAQTIAAIAAYPHINSISRTGDSVTVTVAVAPYIPSGYVAAKYVGANYFWWMDQNRASGLDHNTTVNAAGYTNACVYVYSFDDSNYSYAIHDTVSGSSISNGP